MDPPDSRPLSDGSLCKIMHDTIIVWFCVNFKSGHKNNCGKIALFRTSKSHGNHLQSLIKLIIEFLFHRDRLDDIHINDFVFVDADNTVANTVFEKAHRFIAELCR